MLAMDGGHSTKKRGFCFMLVRSRIGQLILGLLAIFVLSTFISHYYISNFGADGELGYRSRSTKNHPEDADLDRVQCHELKGQITELRRIRGSVNNELRELESKRLSLQTEITKVKTHLEALRIEQENIEKNIKQLTLNLDQLKVEVDEFSNGDQQILKAPLRFIPSSIRIKAKSGTENDQFHICSMFTCFDFSRCSLLSPFLVYVYGLNSHFTDSNLNDFIKSSVYQAFDGNAHITSSPETACIYVAIFGEIFSEESPETIQNKINSLRYWNGDGLNHVLINLARSRSNVDLFHGVKTGRAIIVQSSFVETGFRRQFDIVVPPLLGNSDGEVWAELPPLNPIRRNYLLSFSGQFKDNANSIAAVHNNDIKKAGPQNYQSRTLQAALHVPILNSSVKHVQNELEDLESSIVQQLKLFESEGTEKLSFNFMCESGHETVGINGEWLLCGNENDRANILKQSTFSLIIAPANYTIISTTVFQARLYESLKSGAIPVILGDYAELPFSELLDWSKAVIILPKQRVTELYYLLRTLSNVDMMEFKRNGRRFWETYFGTSKSVVTTMLAVVRTRLNIPAPPVREEPSPTAVSNFIPVPQNLAPDPDEVTDEVLGPVEPPFPSQTFKQNYTVWTLRDPFNMPGDPFHLFPFLPFEKFLPSDSKFFGAGSGYRPINKGEGGSGKEFSESIGGNHPREQFTIVMLTYERSDVLIKAVTRLKGLPHLNKVIVVWNNPTVPSENLGWPEIGVPVVVVKMAKNSLNNRFLPFEDIQTEAVLSIDDDSHLRHDEIVFGFRVWREERDRIVGFPGRYHAWDPRHGGWHYNSNYTCEMSMVITGAAFFHKYYSYLYSYTMAAAIREKVDEYMNCEDIAMNFLVSHITRKPPVKVTSRWTFRCPGCPQQLALDESHFSERHKCINYFVEIYGYMPLLYTQYRADSILFKTRISHDKQKCFKFI
ncbi:exostosin-like 3 [Dreissena polymorpha]|nr:exostosin-like 3 [Dreissena polymorpha]